MQLLALKLLLVPTFLLGLAMCSRWFGPVVAGWLAGLPLVAGPILLVVTLEQGSIFAAGSASAAGAAVLAALAFGAAYAHAALRHAWPRAVLHGLAAWTLAVGVLALVPATWPAHVVIALAALLLAPRLFPQAVPVQPRPAGSAQIVARMVAGAALTLAVSAAAAQLGSLFSGLLGAFPVLGLVLAVSTQHNDGGTHAAALLRGMATGLRSFTAFCLTLALALPRLPVAAAFAAAVLVCVAVQISNRAIAAGSRTA